MSSRSSSAPSSSTLHARHGSDGLRHPSSAQYEVTVDQWSDVKDAASGHHSSTQKGMMHDNLFRPRKYYSRFPIDLPRLSRMRFLVIFFVWLICGGLFLARQHWRVPSSSSPMTTQNVEVESTNAPVPHQDVQPSIEQNVEPAAPTIKINPHPESLARDPCSIDSWYMEQKYGLSGKFRYSRRFVTAVPEPREPDPLNRFGHFDPQPRTLPDPLLTGWDTVTVVHSDAPVVALAACAAEKTINIPVFSPLPETKTKGENLIVGYATTAERIRNRLLSLQHGFAHSRVHLVVQFPSAEMAEGEDVRLIKHMNSLGIRTSLIYDSREYRTRWASLPKTLRLLADDKTQWIMVSDDDAFIVSLPRLLTMLDKYDSKQHHFLGALTDKWQNTKFGAMSFGGSGTFLSLPLVDHLMDYWDDCAAIEKYGGGDQRLTYCIYKNSWTRMTWQQTILNQNDAEGDLQGLFESGQRFGTFHHISWRVRQHDEDQLVRAARSCGESRTECLFQRFLSNCSVDHCSPDVDSRLVLTNGWSIVRYPAAHMPDLGKTEYTWEHEDWDFWSHAMGPLRPKLPQLGSPDFPNLDVLQDAWKETWLLSDVKALPTERLSSRGASHVFIKRGLREGDIDSVIELVWR